MNFIKKETLTQVFSSKFLRTPFLIEHLWWLLFNVIEKVQYNFETDFQQNQLSQVSIESMI